MAFNAEFGVRLVSEVISKDTWLKGQYPRLARAYADFSHHTFDISLQGAILRASQLQAEVVRGFPQDGIVFRKIDPVLVDRLQSYIEQNQGGVIVMRHGKQFLEDEPDTIQGADRKIVMMREKHNINDPAEGQSLVEASAFALILHAISRRHGLPVDVRASENLRAIEVAAPTAFFTRFRVRVDPRLNCVNYRDDLGKDEINQILGADSSGALVWEKDKVDGVCGEGTFDRLSTDMVGLVDALKGAPVITLLSTHTPQMNAVDSYVGEPAGRVPELGFRIVGKNGTSLFPNSIFEAAA